MSATDGRAPAPARREREIREPAATEHLAKLREGVESWNRWRAGASVRPRLARADLSGQHLGGIDLSGADLTGADLSESDLTGADLHDADLADADLFGADLARSNLKMSTLDGADLSRARLASADLYKTQLRGAFMTQADLTGAYLAGADLAGADLRGAVLRGANAVDASFRRARLDAADLTGADLAAADVRDAHLVRANLDGAHLLGLTYGPFSSMAGHFFAVRGLATTHGNALFVRDARDQDYLDTLRRAIDADPRRSHRAVRRAAFAAWSLIDYGRSLARVAAWSLAVALAFAAVFYLDRSAGWGLVDHSGASDSALSPLYFSVVTYTTLGFGDITPSSGVGEAIVIVEVVLGYTTLGLMLSILANRVARRA